MRHHFHHRYPEFEYTEKRYTGVMLGVLAISAGISATGAIMAGNASSNSYKYQAKVNQMRGYLARRTADQNIQLVKQNEEQNISATQMDASEQSAANMRNLQGVRGAQKATLAANGMGDSVTGADIAESTFDSAKRDEIAIRYNADARTVGIENDANQKIWNLNNEAANAEWGAGIESTQYQTAARDASTAGWINVASSVMGGASQVAKSYNSFGGYGSVAGGGGGGGYSDITLKSAAGKQGFGYY